MAKKEYKLHGDFDAILKKIEKAAIDGSLTATLEEKSDFRTEHGRCSIRVFERYSYFGRNRVAMTVVLFEADNEIHLSITTAGGSSAMFFKMNTIGEENFLATLDGVVKDEEVHE